MKKIFLSVCLGLSLILSSVVFSQTASEQGVKQLFLKSGLSEMGSNQFNSLLEQLRVMGLTEAQISEVKKELNLDEFLNLFVPMYQSNFSEDDIRSFLEFYNTSVGQKSRYPTLLYEKLSSDEIERAVTDEQLNDLIKPIYKDFLTDDDILELIAFHNSPAGKKLVGKQPILIKESIIIGQNWGNEIGRKIKQIMSKPQ